MKFFSSLSVSLAACTFFAISADAGTFEQASDDVQILQAWVSHSIQLSLEECSGPLPTDKDPVSRDCTSQGLAKVPLRGTVSPAAAPFLLPVIFHEGRYFSYLYVGNVVELRAVVKRAVIESPVFEGIGFFSASYGFKGIHFVPKRDLHLVSDRDVFLKNGEAAVVLRFVLYFPGWQGNSSTGWAMSSIEFKPFAQFESDGRTFVNWDTAGSNYRLYRAPIGSGQRQVTSINRELELLR